MRELYYGYVSGHDITDTSSHPQPQNRLNSKCPLTANISCLAGSTLPVPVKLTNTICSKDIIEPILAGQTLPDTPADDRQYLIDLGLLRRDPAGGLVISNPIYREVIPRVLVQGTQDSLPHISPSWLTPKGELNKATLLEAFIKFWRQHGEPLLGSAVYHEIAPHIVLMAFLHRVVNGGGILEREYAIGSDRMDLCLRYKDVTLGIELKVWREKKRDPQAEGIEQLESYLARLELNEGWLFVFDRRKNALPIEERLSTQVVVTENQRTITVIRA